MLQALCATAIIGATATLNALSTRCAVLCCAGMLGNADLAVGVTGLCLQVGLGLWGGSRVTGLCLHPAGGFRALGGVRATGLCLQVVLWGGTAFVLQFSSSC